MDPNRLFPPGRGQLSHQQVGVMMEEGPGAIEALMDLDPSFGIAASIGEDLEDVRPEGDGVVVGDDARVLETEQRLGDEVGGPGAIRGLGPSGGGGKGGPWGVGRMGGGGVWRGPGGGWGGGAVGAGGGAAAG